MSEEKKEKKTVSDQEWKRSLIIFLAAVLLSAASFFLLVFLNISREIYSTELLAFNRLQRLDNSILESQEHTMNLTQSFSNRFYRLTEMLDHIAVNENYDAEGIAEAAKRYLPDRNFWLLDQAGSVLYKQGRMQMSEETAQKLTEYDGKIEEAADDNHYYAVTMSNGMIGVIGVPHDRLVYFLDNIYIPEELFTSFMNEGTDYAFTLREGKILYHRDKDAVGETLEEYFREILPINKRMDLVEKGYIAKTNENKYVFLASQDMPEMDFELYYVIDLNTLVRNTAIAPLIISIAILIMLCIISAYWCCLQQDMKYIPNSGLSNGVIRGKVMTDTLVMTLVIGMLAYASFTVMHLSSSITDDSESFDMLNYLYQDSLLCERDLRTDYNRVALEDAQLISAYLSDHPERISRDELENISILFSYDFMILFDTEGKEIVSDSPFYGVTITDDPEDSFAAFQPLKKGIPYVVQDEKYYDLVKSETQIIGVTAKNPDNDVSGFLLTAFQPIDLNYALMVATMTSVLDQSILSASDRYFVIDPDHKVIYSTGYLYDGEDALKIGFAENELNSHYRGYKKISGGKYFMSSAQMGENLIFVGIGLNNLFNGRTGFVIYSIGLLLLGILLILLLNKKLGVPVPETFDTDILPEGIIPDEEGGTSIVSVQTDEGIYKMTLSAAQRISLRKMLWRNCTADQKLSMMLSRIVLILAIAITIVLMFHEKLFGKKSIISYIMSGEWPKGINAFSIIAVCIVAVIGTVIVFIFKASLSEFGHLLSPRAETIARLIRSFLVYITELLILYISLAFLGVDVKSLVASAGILALIIGFGSKDLVKDILAGLFIIFEGEFQVGDVIKIGDYSGMVREIGIRTTKIVSWDRNVKIINNSKISNVVNMTMQTSYAVVDFSVDNTLDLNRLDEIFAKELPRIKDDYQEIISGPEFQAVISFNDKEMKCCIAAEVKELERGSTEIILHREVQQILQSHGIKFK